MRGMLSVRSQVFGGRAEVGCPQAHAANRNTIEIIKTALDRLKFLIFVSCVASHTFYLSSVCPILPILLLHKSAHGETSRKWSKEVRMLPASTRNHDKEIFRLEGNGYQGFRRDRDKPLYEEIDIRRTFRPRRERNAGFFPERFFELVLVPAGPGQELRMLRAKAHDVRLVHLRDPGRAADA